MNSNLQEANDFYKKSQQSPGISRPLKRSYLEKSISLYIKEINQANLTRTRDDFATLQKNLGVASYRLADVLDPEDDLTLIIYYFAEAVKALSMAWTLKAEEQNTEWGGRLEELISDCFEKSHRSLNRDETKFYLLDQISKAIGIGQETDVHRIRFHLANGQYFYRCGVKIMEGNDYKSTLRMLEHARHQYELAGQSAHSFENKVIYHEDISRLNEDISFLRLSCDAIKLREQADKWFDDCVMQSEALNFDMVWNILDMYKASEMHSRNVDIENEAIAFSRQGRIYYKVLNLGSKAHKYYRASFDLATALHPRDMSNCDWFKECKLAMEDFQKAKLREEEARKEKERAPYLGKMKTVLDRLRSHSDDAFKLLKYIYTTHPPKVSFDYDEKSLDSKTIKKAVLNAIIQYHPDKQMQYDMEWRILSEEITKYLNVRYESFKGL